MIKIYFNLKCPYFFSLRALPEKNIIFNGMLMLPFESQVLNTILWGIYRG